MSSASSGHGERGDRTCARWLQSHADDPRRVTPLAGTPRGCDRLIGRRQRHILPVPDELKYPPLKYASARGAPTTG